jgi:hypothetical protein
MMRIGLLLAISGFATLLGPPWVKLDEAFAAASSTDKLIAVYVPLPASDNPEDEASAEADLALISKEVAARYREFFWVKVTDKATIKRIDAPDSGTNLLFLDPDGGTVGVWNLQVGGVKTMLKAMDEAKSLYRPQPVSWFDGEPDESDEKVRKKLIVYAFLDDKEASAKTVKSLEHPWVARDHGRVIFVRKFVLDSPLAKRFKVTSTPTLVFFDANQKEGHQEVDRRTGVVTPKQIRAPMRKFFERMKKAALEGK